MKTAIRYYSKFGHTRQMVEAVKDIVGCEPQTVDTPIEEPVDMLLLGAGVLLGWEHTGGCTLYEHREEVEAFQKQ
jgi:hypothetical protein